MGAKQKLLFTIAAVIIGGLALLAILADNGALDLVRLKKQYRQLLQENETLARENVNLNRQIERLKTDRAYIEHVARRELGMIKENEVVLKSPRSNQDLNGTRP